MTFLPSSATRLWLRCGLLLAFSCAGAFAQSCFYSFDATSNTQDRIPPGGLSGSLTLRTAQGCTWALTGTPPPSWLTVSPSSGSGGTALCAGSSTQFCTTITYTAAANTASAPRTGSFALGTSTASASFSVRQNGSSCAPPGVTPTSLTLPPSNTDPTIPISATLSVTVPSGCFWDVTETADWLTINTPLSGEGLNTGTVILFATANTGAARSTNLSISGVTIPIQQAAGGTTTGCNLTLATTLANIGAAGGASSVAVNIGSGCTWNATSNVSWVRLTGPPAAAGSGPGSLTFNVFVNSGPSRSGTISVGNQIYTVVQAAAQGAPGCSYTLSQTSTSIPSYGTVPGGVGSVVPLTFNLTTTGTNCTWTAGTDTGYVQVFPLSGTGSAVLEYSVFPNYSTATRNATIYLANRPFTLTQAAGTGTADERFVGQMYLNYLGRVPSPSEVTFQVTQGLQAGLTRTQLVSNFLNSAEFDIAGRFIAGAYVGLLARDAEFGGWLFQRSALARGQISRTSLVTNFLQSAEYALAFGNPDDPTYVTLLYRNILLREPSPADITFQVSQLQSGTSRTQLAENFLLGDEFRNRSDLDRLEAFLLYAALLLRDSNIAEFALRRSQIQSGVPLDTLVTEILNSAEFAALLQ